MTVPLELSLPAGCEPRCRGCAHRGWSAAASEAQKAAFLAARLTPWAERLQPLRAVAGAARWGYRDKVRLAAAWRDGRWGFGMRLRDELLALPDCPIHSPRVKAVLAALAERLPPPERFRLAIYVQAGAQATLVVKAHAADWPEGLSEALAVPLRAAGLEGLWLNLFPAAGRQLFARRGWRLLWGQPDSVDGFGMRHGPAAFQQALPELHAQALREAEAFLAPHADAAVLDLYCGLGTTLARWTRAGARALGVEVSAEAVALCAGNAPGAEVLRGLCAQRLPQLEAWWRALPGLERLAYLNPPRLGLEPEVCAWLAERARPARIAYLSCSPGTLARDLGALDAAGYRVASITPYDFFPNTRHVETLALLDRGE